MEHISAYINCNYVSEYSHLYRNLYCTSGSCWGLILSLTPLYKMDAWYVCSI